VKGGRIIGYYNGGIIYPQPLSTVYENGAIFYRYPYQSESEIAPEDLEFRRSEAEFVQETAHKNIRPGEFAYGISSDRIIVGTYEKVIGQLESILKKRTINRFRGEIHSGICTRHE
jgi:hypothetical protein